MYRDDGAALREHGAALTRELAPLRAEGPPGAMARIAEIEEQRAQLRRFAWPYAPLVVAPLLLLATHGDLGSSSLALDAVPVAASVALLWRELSRQRRVLEERVAQIGRPTRAMEKVAPAVVTVDEEPRSVAALVADNRARERELALYKRTGTAREILAHELPLEQGDVAQHGRPFLWLIAVVLSGLVSLKADDWTFPLPVVAGSLLLVVAGFALRASSYAAVLRTRLDLARRELRSAEAAIDAVGSEAEVVSPEALAAQSNLVQEARKDIRTRRKRGDRLFDQRNRVVVGFFVASAVLWPLMQAMRDGAPRPLMIAALSLFGLAATVSFLFAARRHVQMKVDARALLRAELTEELETERLHRFRVALPSVAAEPGVQEMEPPRSREELEAEEERAATASYTPPRELP